MRRKLVVALLSMFVLSIFTGFAGAQNNGKSDLNRNKNQINLSEGVSDYLDIDGEWSRDAVMEATVLQFVHGDGYNYFHPNQPLTKLEAIAMLVNTNFKDDYDSISTADTLSLDSLKKIPDWGKAYVAVALQVGLISNDELQTFNPNQGIKRYEVCIYLARIAGDADVTLTKQEFRDWADIPDAYRAIVQNIRNKGIMNGDENGNFVPNRVVTRAEMAVILGNLEDNVLHRFSDYTIKGEVVDVVASGDVFTITLRPGNGKDDVSIATDQDTELKFLDSSETDPIGFLDILDREVKIYVDNNNTPADKGDDIATLVLVYPKKD